MGGGAGGAFDISQRSTRSVVLGESTHVIEWWFGLQHLAAERKTRCTAVEFLGHRDGKPPGSVMQAKTVERGLSSTETRVPAKLSYVMISLQPIWRVFFYKSVFSSTLWSSVGLGTEAERMYDLFSRVSATSLPSDFKGISVWISVFFWPKCISFVKQYCLNKNFVFRFFQNYEHFFLTGFWMKSHF